MENQEHWLVFFGVDLLLDVLLMLTEQFGVELYVARFVYTMNVTEAGSDGEIWADG
jgi:hypothetical protein